ncbi:MAG: DUF3187 family protein [Nitrospiraceae bacterium]|nr:DUF3187 family protein [Nitrospiraceae bacterium]
MSRTIWWPTLSVLIVLSASAPSAALADGFGPLPVRNFQAIQQLVLQMPGDRANVVKPGTFDVRLELAETSSIARDVTDQAQTTMKFETLRAGLFLRYGVNDRFEVGAEVPVLHRYRGFLEGAIMATERATTGLAPARNALMNVGYAYQVDRAGRTLFSGKEGGTGLGDISFFGKYQVLKETTVVPALSFRVGVKAPTGNREQIFGSGHPDAAVGLAMEKTLASRWIVYANVNGIFPTGHLAGLALYPVMSGLAAVEYLWSENLSFTAQFDYYSSPFHGTGTQTLDKGVTESAVGFSYRVARGLLWQVYGVENLDFITGSAADFTVSTLFTYRFGS